MRLIPLSSVISILPAADQPPLQLSKSHPCALKIISPKRTWTLAADTSADFDRAVKALHAAHKGLHERRRAAEKAGAGDTGRNVEVQVTKVDGGKLVEINVSGVRS